MEARRLCLGLGGRLLAEGRQKPLTRLSTDTRSLKKGDVFLALRGRRFDGENFFKEALRRGASALVGKRPPLKKGVTSIAVGNPLLALQSLAARQRGLFFGEVVAITGSNGKTGTKNCLARLMEGFMPLLSTQGNFNNHIGLPLTLLGLEPEHKAMVLELGMNHAGELRHLGRICRPTVAIELNVGDAHIGHFKSRRALAAAKEELLESMDPSGTAVLNGDDPLVRAMGRRFKGRKIHFGLGASNELRALSVKDKGAAGLKAGLQWKRRRHPLKLRFGGRASLNSALASLAAGLGCGLELEPMMEKMGRYQLESKGRQEIEHWASLTLLKDGYNASPQSMQAALEFLSLSAPKGARLALLGDMLELGKGSRRFHFELGRAARKSGLRALAALGPNAEETLRGFGGYGKAFSADQSEAAAHWLGEEVQKGDWILFKGSRGMAVERVLEALKRSKN
jgi:UDP-N-acetylmuramoyl-tripeptide--D-alanyl-D-alanine ligase